MGRVHAIGLMVLALIFNAANGECSGRRTRETPSTLSTYGTNNIESREAQTCGVQIITVVRVLLGDGNNIQ